MLCAEIKPLLSAYADDALATRERAQVAHHLESCHDCKGNLLRERHTLLLLQMEAGNNWSPPDMRLRIAHSIAGHQHAQRRRRKSLAATSAGALAVAVMVLTLHVVPQPMVASPALHSATVATNLPQALCLPCLAATAERQEKLPPAQHLATLAEVADASLEPVGLLGLTHPNARSVSSVKHLKGGEGHTANTPAYQGLPAS